LPQWILDAILNVFVATPLIGDSIAPLVAAVVPTVWRMALWLWNYIAPIFRSLPTTIGAINLNSIVGYIESVPVIGALIAPVIELAPTAVRYLQSLLSSIGLDSVADIITFIERININAIISMVTNLFQGVQSGVGGIPSSVMGIIPRFTRSANRMIGDLQLSIEWFMNPENPRGYHEITRRFNLFTAPRTQPHPRANQPPRVGFIYSFPDPFLLSHNLTPSYYVAGGRI
jgi:phage-related protein